MMMRVKKNDTVIVLSGKDKDKKGTVIDILPKKGKVKIKDVAIVARHTKPRKQGETPKIVKKESFIDISKVMPICNACQKPTIYSVKMVDNIKKLACKHCKEIK